MTNLFASRRFLAIYSGTITLIFLCTVLCGFAEFGKNQKFDQIDVQRINVVEADGTLRMVISNKTEFPGIIIKGKETPHPSRKTAGVLFFNDEGTENGGLIFGGSKNGQGKVNSYGHLSFDQYEQDQVFTIDAGEEEGRQSSNLRIVDQPAYSISEDIEAADRIGRLPKDEQTAGWENFFTTHQKAQTRIDLGRSDDHSVALRLKDTNGRDRIVVQVRPDGTPLLQFLDATGKIVSQLPQASQSPGS